MRKAFVLILAAFVLLPLIAQEYSLEYKLAVIDGKANPLDKDNITVTRFRSLLIQSRTLGGLEIE